MSNSLLDRREDPIEEAKRKKQLAILAAAVAAVIIFAMIAGPKEQPNEATRAITATAPVTPDWNSTESKMDALFGSRRFMEQKLKAPASATFAGYTDRGVSVSHDGGGAFTVHAYVDAQNSFGANLRTRYTCKLRHEGDKWRLISLTTEP